MPDRTIDQTDAANAAGLGTLERIARDRAQEEAERSLPRHRNQVFLEQLVETVRTRMGYNCESSELLTQHDFRPLLRLPGTHTYSREDFQRLMDLGAYRFRWASGYLEVEFSANPDLSVFDEIGDA